VGGTGAECSAEGTLRITGEKDPHLPGPRALTPQHFAVLASGEDVRQTMRPAVPPMVDFFVQGPGMGAYAADRLLSLAGGGPHVPYVPAPQPRQNASGASGAGANREIIMAYDLLIKNGRIIDGSGMPAFRGDVAVRGGKIVELGKLSGTATRVIDADGLVVSP